MKKLKKNRKLSHNELSYLKLKHVAKNYFQIVLECEKNSVNLIKLKKVVKEIPNYSKFINTTINKDTFYFKKVEIKLNIFEEEIEFDGINIDKINLFNSENLNNIIELRFFKNNTKDYLIFKFNHSYVDGQGAIYLIKLVLDLLNEKDVEKDLEDISDMEYIKSTGTTSFKENLGYTNKIKTLGNREKKIIIKRLKLNQTTNAILAKIIKVLTENFENEDQIYIVPSSIRMKSDSKKYISNLTLPIYLHVNKFENWNEIYFKIFKSIKEKKNLNINNVNFGIGINFSSYIFKIIVNISQIIQNKTKRYFTAGSITNMGIFNIKEYNGNNIKINRIFNIPFFQPLLPLSVTIMENENGVDIIFVTNSKIINEENVNKIFEKIENILNLKE